MLWPVCRATAAATAAARVIRSSMKDVADEEGLEGLPDAAASLATVLTLDLVVDRPWRT